MGVACLTLSLRPPPEDLTGDIPGEEENAAVKERRKAETRDKLSGPQTGRRASSTREIINASWLIPLPSPASRSVVLHYV